jgi:hypothetical protein
MSYESLGRLDRMALQACQSDLMLLHELSVTEGALLDHLP